MKSPVFPIVFLAGFAAANCLGQGVNNHAATAAHEAAVNPANANAAVASPRAEQTYRPAPEPPRSSTPAEPVKTNGAAATSPAANTANAAPGTYAAPGSPAYSQPGNQHYVYGAQKSYPYYSSGATKLKSVVHRPPAHVRVSPPPHHQPRLYPEWGYPGYYFLCDYEFLYFDAINSSVLAPDRDNEATNISLDGYMVYNNDTMAGSITIDGNKVYLVQPIDGKKEWSGNTSLADKSLKEIALYKGNKELYLSRLNGDNKMWRVLHTGKLNIYDNQIKFPAANNIGNTNIKVVIAGQVHNLRALFSEEPKQQLIKYVNEAYDLQLQPKNFTWKTLLDYIDTLH